MVWNQHKSVHCENNYIYSVWTWLKYGYSHNIQLVEMYRDWNQEIYKPAYCVFKTHTIT